MKIIPITALLPKDSHQKLETLSRWGKLQQEQLAAAIAITKEAVQDFLKKQAESGNWQVVQEVLKGKNISKAGEFLLKEIRDKVVGKLIKRLALRPFIALALAVVLIPLIIAKLSGEVVTIIKKGKPS